MLIKTLTEEQSQEINAWENDFDAYSESREPSDTHMFLQCMITDHEDEGVVARFKNPVRLRDANQIFPLLEEYIDLLDGITGWANYGDYVRVKIPREERWNMMQQISQGVFCITAFDPCDSLSIRPLMHRDTLGELILGIEYSNLTSSGKFYPVSFIYEVIKNFSMLFARQWCARLEQLLSKEDLDELNCQQWVFEH